MNYSNPVYLQGGKHHLESLREDFLHDPDYDNDTINWALEIIDEHIQNCKNKMINRVINLDKGILS
jgi:hypothetical protein